MKWLLVLIVAAPIVELGLLIWAGTEIGLFPTLGLLLAIGLVGAFLARRQGLKTYRDIQESLSRGEQPAEQLVKGIFIVIGGLLLLLPGFLSDLVALTLFFQPTQKIYRPLLNRWFQKRTKNARIIVQ